MRSSLQFVLFMGALCHAVSCAAHVPPSPIGPLRPWLPFASGSRCFIQYSQQYFETEGKKVAIELFGPVGAKKYPIIIMIHGSAGVFTRNGNEMPAHDNFGEKEIASHCYLVALVHYLDVSGIRSVSDIRQMYGEAPRWTGALVSAIDYLQRLPNADPARVGLFGESMGGFLAVEIGMLDSRVKAISEFSGGLPDVHGDRPQRRRLPPLLIQHGGSDSIVFVDEAMKLASLAKADHTYCELIVYPGLNHYFDAAARMQVRRTTIKFFDRILRENKQEPVDDTNMGR